MLRLMPKELGVLGVVASLVVAGSASGQWLALPNGAVGYTTDLFTSARFFCSHYILTGACNASGNTLVLGNAGNTMTISFTGVSTQLTASNQKQAPIKIGTFTTVVSGNSTFQFPPTKAPSGWYIAWGIDMESHTPAFEKHTLGGTFGLTAFNVLSTQARREIVFHTIMGASGPFYPELAYSNINIPSFSGSPGELSYDVFASPSLTPEPSTNILLASGLLGLGMFVRRRRSRA